MRGRCSPAPSTTAASGSIPIACGSPSTSPTTRRRTSGATRSASPPSGSSAAAWPITTGPWAFPGRAARARRSFTTAARSTASTVGPRPTRTAISRSGTSCSWRTSEAKVPEKIPSRSSARCRRRTSIPAWASNVSRFSCRAWRTSTKPTCCARSSRPQRSSRARCTAARTPTTFDSASSPTTPAPATCSSRTE